MRELHVIGLTEDGRHLLLAGSADTGRATHRVPVDDRLDRALRGEGVERPDDGPTLSPRDIQARLRAGSTVEEVAAAAGLPAARVQRFAGPVLSEREEILRRVAASHQDGRRGRSVWPLGRSVEAALSQVAHVRPETLQWTAYRRPDNTWVARVEVVVRGRGRSAQWLLDGDAAVVRPLDPWASTLGHAEPPARKRAAAAPATTPGKTAKAPAKTAKAPAKTSRGTAKAPAKASKAPAKATKAPAKADQGTCESSQGTCESSQGTCESSQGTCESSQGSRAGGCDGAATDAPSSDLPPRRGACAHVAMMRPGSGVRRVGLSLALGLAALTGCSGGSGGSATATGAPVSNQQLDAARVGFDRARGDAAAAVADLVTAAAALDRLEGLAVTGAFTPAQRQLPVAADASSSATSAAARLPSLAAAYLHAVDALAAARTTPGLTGDQRSALQRLGTAARGEAASLAALAKDQHAGWAVYGQLQAAEGLWVTRAGAGYYAQTDNDRYDPKRAGQAFVVLVNPFRAALTAERTRLADESRDVTRARAATATALTAAQAAFR